VAECANWQDELLGLLGALETKRLATKQFEGEITAANKRAALAAINAMWSATDELDKAVLAHKGELLTLVARAALDAAVIEAAEKWRDSLVCADRAAETALIEALRRREALK
jgi:hypothetical protein